MNEYCVEFERLYDVVCMLEDRQDDGQLVDESVMSKARYDFEYHKRNCEICKRPDTPAFMAS